MTETRSGGRFDSYIGTYKGIYKSEPARLENGMTSAQMAKAQFTANADNLSRQMVGSQGSAGDGGSIVPDLLFGAEVAATETYDVTARFYLEGNRYRVEVKTLKHESGAKPYTDVHDFGLNLTKQLAAVEFHAQTEDTTVVHDGRAGDGYVDDYNKAKAVDNSGRAFSHVIDFSLSAMDCKPGSDVPQRLHESVTKKSMKIITDLYRQQ